MKGRTGGRQSAGLDLLDSAHPLSHTQCASSGGVGVLWAAVAFARLLEKKCCPKIITGDLGGMQKSDPGSCCCCFCCCLLQPVS